MKTPYLIQRASFAKKEAIGIDSILQFDYMGSSEFEWGALPKSLKAIRRKIDEYTYLEFFLNDKFVTVFCPKSQVGEIGVYLNKLAADEYRLKEWSDFNTYIYPGHFENRADFWWDIENHLMFWKKNVEFEKEFKALIAPAKIKL